jgi:hypothetical protein
MSEILEAIYKLDKKDQIHIAHLILKHSSETKEVNKTFNAISLETKSFVFNREQANER